MDKYQYRLTQGEIDARNKDRRNGSFTVARAIYNEHAGEYRSSPRERYHICDFGDALQTAYGMVAKIGGAWGIWDGYTELEMIGELPE